MNLPKWSGRDFSLEGDFFQVDVGAERVAESVGSYYDDVVVDSVCDLVNDEEGDESFEEDDCGCGERLALSDPVGALGCKKHLYKSYS